MLLSLVNNLIALLTKYIDLQSRKSAATSPSLAEFWQSEVISIIGVGNHRDLKDQVELL